MRIAYVCHHMRPNYEYDWIAGMPVDKVKFITTDKNEKSTDPRVEYCQVQFEEKGWENKVIVSPKDASSTRRVFYHGFEKYLEDVDVVIVLELFSSLTRQFIDYCHSVNKPVVVLVYELLDKHPIYYIPRYSFNTRYALKHADHFVAVSNAAGKHLEVLGAKKPNISVIYPGIDMNIFRPTPKVIRDNHSIMFVGKLEVHKGIDLTIELFRRLVVTVPDLKLTVAGSGTWKQQVEQLAADFPNNVTYANFIPHNELPGELSKHGLYIMPAHDTKRYGLRIGAEQFGFSIVEAMACGLAAITTDCGALGEIVTDKNIVCAQDDLEDLRAKTLDLLQHPKRLGEIQASNIKLASKRYDLIKQSAAFAELLARIVADRASKPAQKGR